MRPLTSYTHGYLDERDKEIDKTEWIDILRALKAFGASRNETIVEWGAGRGHLVKFLRLNGYKKVYGYDLLWSEPDLVFRRDVTLKPHPVGDICISQHFLEHIDQEKAISLLDACLSKGWLSINIVPGHMTRDETHKVPFYTYSMLEEIASRITSAKYYYIYPDTRSFVSPESMDWILVLSKKPLTRRGKIIIKPLWLRALLVIAKALISVEERTGLRL